MQHTNELLSNYFIVKSLLLRSITGALFVAVIISAIFFGETSFLLIFSAIVAYALFEFYHLLGKMHKEKKIIILLDIIAGTYLFIQIFQIAASGSILTPFTLTPYWFYLVIRLIMQLYIKDENPIESWAHSFLGHIYIALPLGLLGNIAFSQDIYNSTLLLAFFACIWINDTGAFLIGCTFGKHRLFERISPKKSWEGFFGGLAFCIAGSFIAAHYFDFLNTWQWVGLAVTISIFSIWGDLCESLIKRTLTVKDSGKLLPGHGGILDRFDSVLIASPAALFYLSVILG